MNAEYTRKFVHIGTGLLTMFFPVLFTHYTWVIVICGLFFILLSISLQFGFLPSINSVQRKSYGSLAYPAVVILTFVFYYFKTKNFSQNYFYFYIPILTMALADPVAALFGQRFPFGKFSIGKEQKTIVGSIAFFLVALAVNFLLLPTNNVLFLFLIPLAATFAEAFTNKGLDNLTIPVSIIFVLYFYPCV
ncbi:hypothetical protein [Fluviicola sp.]|uniref:diacylglycerol/polyprenol kinase family protein n=1 Tax=Fluviicola sp. TaxID=1917219 RepID=UPI00282EB3B1|nr:hypothetical protein [Fluviicola sp.]MDR0802196.1 hypothetical protein [Fluviicola sp.]